MLARIRDQRDVDYVIQNELDRYAHNRRDDANSLRTTDGGRWYRS